MRVVEFVFKLVKLAAAQSNTNTHTQRYTHLPITCHKPAGLSHSCLPEAAMQNNEAQA